jgi:hypothetical protein
METLNELGMRNHEPNPRRQCAFRMQTRTSERKGSEVELDRVGDRNGALPELEQLVRMGQSTSVTCC